jgi:hypothetical protein
VDAQPCEVTIPNGQAPPGETPGPTYHGNGRLWVGLPHDGRLVAGAAPRLRDGSMALKFGWWRGVRGLLLIDGHRLDGPAPQLLSSIPAGYGDLGFQATTLVFPTDGCWQVTGRVGDDELSFVIRVVEDEGV